MKIFSAVKNTKEVTVSFLRDRDETVPRLCWIKTASQATLETPNRKVLQLFTKKQSKDLIKRKKEAAELPESP